MGVNKLLKGPGKGVRFLMANVLASKRGRCRELFYRCE